MDKKKQKKQNMFCLESVFEILLNQHINVNGPEIVLIRKTFDKHLEVQESVSCNPDLLNVSLKSSIKTQTIYVILKWWSPHHLPV